MPIHTDEWREEFREYFDKNLKPIKPTMKNLDRELCVDFISKLLLKEREAVKREIMVCIPAEKELLNYTETAVNNRKGFNECRQQTLETIKKL